MWSTFLHHVVRSEVQALAGHELGLSGERVHHLFEANAGADGFVEPSAIFFRDGRRLVVNQDRLTALHDRRRVLLADPERFLAEAQEIAGLASTEEWSRFRIEVMAFLGPESLKTPHSEAAASSEIASRIRTVRSVIPHECVGIVDSLGLFTALED